MYVRTVFACLVSYEMVISEHRIGREYCVRMLKENDLGAALEWALFAKVRLNFGSLTFLLLLRRFFQIC